MSKLQYDNDAVYKAERESWVGKRVHNSKKRYYAEIFEGFVYKYLPNSDHYDMRYEDGDAEKLPYSGMKLLVQKEDGTLGVKFGSRFTAALAAAKQPGSGFS